MTHETGTKRISLLLGAGFCVPAGLPTSNQLAETFKTYINDKARSDNHSLLKFLHFYIEGGIRLQRAKQGKDPSESVNIEEIAVAARCLNTRELNPLAPFISGWHPHLNEMLGKDPDLILSYLDCFNDHLLQSLKVPDSDKIAWMDRIAECAYQFNEIDIFSLNYDCCLETALNSYCVGHTDLKVADGFDEHGWKPELFQKPPDVKASMRLYKMHGSLDWVDSEEYGLMCTSKVNPEILEEFLGYPPHLVFGTEFKLTGAQPFFTMAHLFFENLTEANALVVIGYSFSDEYINSLIQQSQRQNPELQLIIVNPNAADLERDSLFLKGMQNKYFEAEDAKKLISDHGLTKLLKRLLASNNAEAPF